MRDTHPTYNTYISVFSRSIDKIETVSCLFCLQIAAEVAAPLAKTEEIVLIGGSDNTTAEITRLVGQIPPAVNALTGVDLSKVLGKIPGANVKQQSTVAS